MPLFRDISGQRFGRRVALRFVEMRSKQAVWFCRCDCGTEGEATLGTISKTQSCGCLQKEVAAATQRKHGHAPRGGATLTYRIWQGMITRCHSPSTRHWPQYGGRGIEVCARWRDSYTAFLTDMGEAKDGLSIDRIDNNGPYAPGNCRWATREVQARNTRRNRFLTWDGRTATLMEWSRQTGIHHRTIGSRLKLGWSLSAALTTPAVSGRNQTWTQTA
jgi:hypothetical protein